MSHFSPAVASAIVLGAQRHGLDPALVAAIVMHESSGNPMAVRSEPKYRWVVDVETGKPFRRLDDYEITSQKAPVGFFGLPGCSSSTEWTLQRCSLGLMQIMGANAREHGFAGTFLTDLLDPTEGVEFGCRYLAELQKRFEFEAAISAYNAGSPAESNRESYVIPVLRNYEIFRKEGV